VYSHFQENGIKYNVKHLQFSVKPFLTCGADSWTVTTKIRKSLHDMGKENSE
jgi:hypothetical protein